MSTREDMMKRALLDVVVEYMDDNIDAEAINLEMAINILLSRAIELGYTVTTKAYRIVNRVEFDDAE